MNRAAFLVCFCLVVFVANPTASAAGFDPNGDSMITGGDVFYLINHLFADGPAPVGGGDATGDSSVTVADLFFLINYLYAGGPEPAGPVIPPAVTSFAPTSGWVEYTKVTINGTELIGAKSVTFGGASAAYRVVSGTQIIATVPTGATTGPIELITPGGTATSATPFTVNLYPMITSVDPTSGPVLKSVTIDGIALSGATSVKFGGTSAGFSVVSDMKITATVPSGATTGPIAVTTPWGTATSAMSFTVIPKPLITSFAPTNGPVGASVTINGSGLSGPTSVQLGGVSASYRVDSDTKITATVPPGVPYSPTTGFQSGTFKVSTAGGNATSSTSFIVLPPPVITSFTPSNGSAGTTVTISGSGLSATTGVKFGGVSASFSLQSGGDPSGDFTQIIATVPAGATTGPIAVTITLWGTIWSSATFTVSGAGTPAPAITSFAPTNGPVGTSVTLNGSGLGGATSVTFGGTAASYSVLDFTKITASVPSGATSGPIAVTTPGGAATSTTGFTVIPAPVITSFAPTSGPVGASVTINVAGLIAPTSVKFGGVPADYSFFLNLTVITILATVPPGTSTGPITVTTAGGTASSATNFTVKRLTAADFLGDIDALKRSYSIKHWDGMDYPALFLARGVGGHIQGIAQVGSAWVLSHSRDSAPGLLIWGNNNNWKFGNFDLGDHPGGIQASGDVVIVTYKKYGSGETTGIKFFQVDSAGPHELAHLRLPNATITSAGYGEAAGLAYHPVERRYYVFDDASQDPQPTAGESSKHRMYRSTKPGAPLTDPGNGWELFANKVKARGSEGGSELMYDETTKAMYLVALSRPEGNDIFSLNTHRVDITWLDLQTKCMAQSGSPPYECDFTSGYLGYRAGFDRTLNVLVDPTFRFGAGLLFDEGTGRISVIATERCTSFEFSTTTPVNELPCEEFQDLVDYFILTP